MKQDYDKMRRNLRQWLLGKNYINALNAMELGLRYHTGFRKDGVTPEFQHQISQAMFARTLSDLMLFPEEVIVVVLLHDIVEDTEIKHQEVLDYLSSKGMTENSLKMVDSGLTLMNNQYGDGFVNGEKSPKKPKHLYYTAMIPCPVASVCKGLDRMHNHQSMIGVFDSEKQQDYIAETQDYIIPMLKEARKEWPHQEHVYTNIKHVLQVQMEFVEAMNGV